MECPELNSFQQKVVNECIEKGSGGLSLPMGSGKTFISLALSHAFKGGNGKSLVIVAKTLVNSWVFEIKKFYPNCKYHVFHDEYKNKNVYTFEQAEIIILTPEVASKYYKLYNISHLFIEFRSVQVNINLETVTNYYSDSNTPFLKENIGEYLSIKSSDIDKKGLPLYTEKWKCLFVDEVQKYVNISSDRCKSIISISANHRWLLSGTILSEPRIERILGYYLLLNHADFPRTLPVATSFVKSLRFKGLNETLVSRKKNDGVKKEPELIQKIVEHSMTSDEIQIYMSIKDIMLEFRKKFIEYKNTHNVQMTRKFTAYIMALLGYLRQSLVCPLMPFSSACIDALDISTDNIMAESLVNTIKKKVSIDYLSNKESAFSSRIKSVMLTLETHKDEKVVLFSCYRTSVDMIAHYINITGRPFFTIKGSDNLTKRNKVIEEFKNSKNGVLGMTYEIGSEGLNLQFAHVALLVDFFWNDSKTSQAIARIMRYGQLSEKVYIYLFTSHTGIENAIFSKQKIKLEIIEELKIGSSNKKIKNLNMNDVLKMIDTQENQDTLYKIRNIN